MSKLKILLLNTQMEAAGAQKAMLTLARGLQQRGHAVTVVTMYDKADYVPLFKQKYGVNIIDLGMKSPTDTSTFQKTVCTLKGLGQLWQLIRRERFDVVQTFTHYSNIIGPIIAWLAGIKIRISSQRNSLVKYPPWFLWLDRVIANSFLVQRMIAVSEDTRKFSISEQGIAASKLVTIYNSVNTERFQSVELSLEDKDALRYTLSGAHNTKIVLTIAKLHPQKGHRYLIQSIPGILKEFSEVHFLFAGEGELCQELTLMTQQLGVVDVVSFLGVRQDIPQLLSVSDIFVLPSLWEGMPNAVLEAMAVGTPVITTNVGGCPEIIRDGETGILIPSENSDALAQAIIRLLGDAPLRQQLSQAAQHWVVEHFSEEKNISAFEQLYQSLILAKV